MGEADQAIERRLGLREARGGHSCMPQQQENGSTPLVVAYMMLNHSPVQNLAVCCDLAPLSGSTVSKQSRMCNAKARLGAEVFCREKKIRMRRGLFFAIHCPSFGRNKSSFGMFATSCSSSIPRKDCRNPGSGIGCTFSASHL